MYPLMLYRGGVTLTDHCTVNDEAEQAAAEAEGYALLNMAAVKGWDVPAVPPVPDEPVKRGPGRPRKA